MNWPSGFFARNRKQVIIDLIAASSGVALDIDEVTFGKVSEADQIPTDDSDPNTFIEISVTGGYDDRFQGQNGLLYRRVRFREAGVNFISGGINYPNTVHSLLGLINERFNINLTKEDVEDSQIPSPVTYITLKAKPGSPIWFGETRLYTTELLYPKFQLDGFREFVPAQ